MSFLKMFSNEVMFRNNLRQHGLQRNLAMLSTTALRVGVGVTRLGSGGGRTIQVRALHKGSLAVSWVNKVLDNPLPLGAGALVVGLLQLRRIREREERKAASGVNEEEEVKIAEEWKVIIPSLNLT